MTTHRTTLGQQCNLTGDLVLDGDTVFLGRLEGTLRSDGPVEIGGTATVRGIVDAQAVRLAGTVEGEVTGRNQVTLLGGSHVVGEVNTSRFEVAAGATFEGVASLANDAEHEEPAAPIRAAVYAQEVIDSIDHPGHDEDEDPEQVNVVLNRRRVKPRRTGPRGIDA